MDDGGTGSEEQQLPQPAVPGHASADAEHSASPPESVTPASSNGDISLESAEKNDPNPESENTALELQRSKDAQENIDTRPPDGETVTFRSVTVADIYAGQAADSLVTALAAIDWNYSDESVGYKITEARKDYQDSRGFFWLLEETSVYLLSQRGEIFDASDMSHDFPGFGRTSLPSGIDYIVGEYYVVGPSTVAIVLTFVLVDDEARRLDAALREDAKPTMGPYSLAQVSNIRTVEDVKRERIRDIRAEVARRCLTWLKDKMPGTLSATEEGPGPPTCALVSLAAGKPFDSQAEYMALLGLTRASFRGYFAGMTLRGLRPTGSVEKFVSDDFLFLVRPSGRATDGGLMAAFNEADARSHSWIFDLDAAPEVFHREISSFMIADGLNAALLSFEPRLRDVRAGLDQLDFNKASGSQVIALRNRLLGISRGVSIISSDVTVLVADAVMIWRYFSPLARVEPPGGETTGDTKRRQLLAVMESLRAQEADLRELILVTSASMSETQVLGLTSKLNRLTTWLIILSGVLVALGVAALVVQVENTPTVTVHITPTPPASSRTASPTPVPSSSLSGSAPRTTARTRK